MSATIRVDLESFNPAAEDGWHHNGLASAYLYPEVAASDFEDACRMRGGAGFVCESEDRTVYEVTGGYVAEFLERMGELAAAFPAIPAGFERADMTLTFLY